MQDGLCQDIRYVFDSGAIDYLVMSRQPGLKALDKLVLGISQLLRVRLQLIIKSQLLQN